MLWNARRAGSMIRATSQIQQIGILYSSIRASFVVASNPVLHDFLDAQIGLGEVVSCEHNLNLI